MTNKSKVTWGIVAIVLSLFGWWISDIPIGYYQFKQMCKDEGGVRKSATLKQNVGWLAAHEIDAKAIVQTYSNVPFARFRSDDGVWSDVKYKGGYGAFSKYEVGLADQTKEARYRQLYKVEQVKSAIRLRKEILVILDESSNQTVFEFARFIFTWTRAKNTLLGRSESAECPSYDHQRSSVLLFIKSKSK